MAFNIKTTSLEVVFFNGSLKVSLLLWKLFIQLILFCFPCWTLKMTRINMKKIFVPKQKNDKRRQIISIPINIVFINCWHSKMRPHLLIYVIQSRVAMIRSFTFLPRCFCYLLQIYGVLKKILMKKKWQFCRYTEVKCLCIIIWFFKGNAPFLSVLIITFVGSNDYFISSFFDVLF